MACDALTYSSVDGSKWRCAKDLVQREYAGIHIGSDQGQASARGFTLTGSYDAGQQRLKIQ